MKFLLVGDLPLANATLFASRPDVHTGKVADVAGALAVAEPGEPTIAAMRLSTVDPNAIEAIRDLSAAGVSVLALASEATPTLRASGFEAGAADVVFPPINAERIESAVLSMLGRPARRETRFSTDAKVLLAVGKESLAGTLLDLSVGGVRAQIAGALPVGGGSCIACRCSSRASWPSSRCRAMPTSASTSCARASSARPTRSARCSAPICRRSRRSRSTRSSR